MQSDVELAEALNGYSISFAYHSGKIENGRVTYHDVREIFDTKGSLVARLSMTHGIINTKTAATLDFSGVAAFLVTNSLLVQCSIAVLLYFYECRPFHLFPSICDP